MGRLSRLLSRLLGYVAAEEREGISFPPGPHWDVDHPEAQFPELLRRLPDLMPPGSTVYLEGGPADEVDAFLEARAVENSPKFRMGTIWPRPLVFHIALTLENMTGLAALAERYVIPQIADHLQIYRDGQVLLAWYDMASDAFCVSKEIPEAALGDWCAELHLQYKDCSIDV